MLLRVMRKDVIEGLQKSAQIIPAKTGAAFLRTIWLNTADSSLSVMSTDSNLEFRGVYTAQVEEDGLAGVQGRSFYDLIRKLPEGEITIKTENDGQNLVIQQGRRKYKLPTNEKSWFQPFASFPDNGTVWWAGDMLADIIDKISFCISDEDTMEAIACLHMVPKSDDAGSRFIEVCGLNGHQFAMFTFVNDDIHEMLPDAGILIQKKYLMELKKWLTDDEIELAISDKRLFFRSKDGSESFSLPLSYYQYPDYNTFLTKVRGDDTSELHVSREEMVDALDRIMIFNSDNNRCTNMKFGDTEVTLTSQGQEMGSATESLEGKYQGSLERIAFPTRNLIELLGHFDSRDAVFTLTGTEGPCQIKGEEDPDYLVIIMPMKIVEETYYNEEDI
jgi:DNA polymerase-3 subunit beta